MTHIIDSFDIAEAPAWRVDEKNNDGIVDGVNYLARVEGPFFLVEGASRNGRYYSKGLWEKAITESNMTMASGQMLGTIGHGSDLSDEDLMEGKASHRVSKLWIDEKHGIGMGEILVLNTKAGQSLNAYLRGGVTFPVSSRATGDYTGKKVGGANEIDPSTFKLERFDFVRVPGVEKAVPRLVESEDKVPNAAEAAEVLENVVEKTEPKSSGETDMSKELIEQLTTEKLDLQKQVDEILNSNDQLKSKNAVLADKLETLEAKLVEVTKKLTDASEALATAEAAGKTYESVGTPAFLQEAVEELNTLKSSLEPIGSVDAIVRVFEELDSLAEGMTISKVVALVEAAGYLDAEALTERLDLLSKYEELGDVATIEESLDGIIALTAKLKEESVVAETKNLATEAGISESMATRLLDTMSYDEALEMVKELTPSKTTDEKDESVDAKAATNKKIDERFTVRDDKKDEGKKDVKTMPKALSGSRATRLFEGM